MWASKRPALNTGLLAAALLVVGTGCSLLVDTDPYLGNGSRDGGPVDGAVDGSVDPDAPTMPEVVLSPEMPTTTDDLVSAVSVESTDPMGQTVSYERVWLRDGAAVAGQTGATLPSSETSSGEVWRVEITPVSEDGRRGPAGVQEVTIGNTPPVLRSARLSDYRPVLGEELVLTAGTSFDIDSDGIGFTHAWFRNGSVIAEATGAQLDTSMFGIEAGDQITATLTVRDAGGDGNSVTVGPAIVLEDVTRWRQVLPDRTAREARAVVHDSSHERVLYIYSETGPDGEPRARVWEYALDGSDRFTQLFPTGPSPRFFFPVVIEDEPNQRMLFFTGGEDFDTPFSSPLYSLDVSQRGAESWTRVNAINPPEGRNLASFALDRSRDRVLMYGGADPTTTPRRIIHDFWSLDISTPGSEEWTRHDIGLPPMMVIGGGLVVDEARDRLLLVGGGTWDGMSAPDLVDTIYTLDLADMSTGFLVQTPTVPNPRLLGATYVEGDRLLIAGGSHEEEPLSSWISLDLETLAAEEITPSASGGPVEGANGWIARTDDGLLFFPGSGLGDESRFSLYEVDDTFETLTPMHVTGVDLPGGVQGGYAAEQGRMMLYGGRDENRELPNVLWRLDPERREFEQRVTLPDAIDSSSPDPRYGQSVESSSRFGSRIPVFGGVDADELRITDPSAWTLEASSGQWIHHTLAAGAPLIPVTEGSAFFRPSCGGLEMAFYGGANEDGENDQTFGLDCDGAGRNCHWERLQIQEGDSGYTPPPAARMHATVNQMSDVSRALMFGGRSGAGPQNTVYALSTCGGRRQWVRPAVVGTPPEARFHHSTVLARPVMSSAPDRLLVFGGRGNASNDWMADAHFLTVTDVTGDGTYRWSPITPAAGPNDDHISPRQRHAAVWLRSSQQLIVYGGAQRGAMSDLWVLDVRP